MSSLVDIHPIHHNFETAQEFQVIDINLGSTFLLCKYAIKKMLKKLIRVLSIIVTLAMTFLDLRHLKDPIY